MTAGAVAHQNARFAFRRRVRGAVDDDQSRGIFRRQRAFFDRPVRQTGGIGGIHWVFMGFHLASRRLANRYKVTGALALDDHEFCP